MHTELGSWQRAWRRESAKRVGKELGEELARWKCRWKLMQTWSRRNWRRRRGGGRGGRGQLVEEEEEEEDEEAEEERSDKIYQPSPGRLGNHDVMKCSVTEGSLEVKLLTVWTDEKQRREESERREE